MRLCSTVPSDVTYETENSRRKSLRILNGSLRAGSPKHESRPMLIKPALPGTVQLHVTDPTLLLCCRAALSPYEFTFNQTSDSACLPQSCLRQTSSVHPQPSQEDPGSETASHLPELTQLGGCSLIWGQSLGMSVLLSVWTSSTLLAL